jgi:hypothetical protein
MGGQNLTQQIQADCVARVNGGCVPRGDFVPVLAWNANPTLMYLSGRAFSLWDARKTGPSSSRLFTPGVTDGARLGDAPWLTMLVSIAGMSVRRALRFVRIARRH